MHRWYSTTGAQIVLGICFCCYLSHWDLSQRREKYVGQAPEVWAKQLDLKIGDSSPSSSRLAAFGPFAILREEHFNNAGAQWALPVLFHWSPQCESQDWDVAALVWLKRTATLGPLSSEFRLHFTGPDYLLMPLNEAFSIGYKYQFTICCLVRFLVSVGTMVKFCCAHILTSMLSGQATEHQWQMEAMRSDDHLHFGIFND